VELTRHRIGVADCEDVGMARHRQIDADLHPPCAIVFRIEPPWARPPLRQRQGAQWSRAPWGLSRLSTGLAAVGTLYCRSALIGEARLRVMGEGGWRFTGRGVQRGGGGRTDLGLGRPPQRCGNGPQRTSLCAWSVRTGPRANGPPGGCLIIPRGQRGCLPMRGPPGQGWNHLVRRVGVARGHCRAPSIAQRVCTA
jgi:hypothetical protein